MTTVTDTGNDEDKIKVVVKKPGKDPPLLACFYEVVTDTDTDKDKVTDLVRTIKVVVKKPGKDPPLAANWCEATTGDDLQVGTVSMGDDKDKITDVVDVNNNDRDCAGPHLTPETLLKRSGRDETDGDPLHGQRL